MTAPYTPGKAYWKNGHWVVDTDALDSSGHIPTHRLDQPTNRGVDEPWQQYEQRVLHRSSFSPDTAQVSSLSALQPEVADSTRSLMNAARQAGVNLSPAETRRSQERQEMLFQRGRSAPGDVATWTLTSDHTPGRAVDFSGDDAAYSWLQAHAPEHGFSVMGSMDPGHVSMPGGSPQAPPAQAPPRSVPRFLSHVPQGASSLFSHIPPPSASADRPASPFEIGHGSSGSWGDRNGPLVPRPVPEQANHGSSDTIDPNPPASPMPSRPTATISQAAQGPTGDINLGSADSPSDDYETTLKKWADDKISQGANPDSVNIRVAAKLQKYRSAKKPTETHAPPSNGWDTAAGALATAYQGATMGLGNKLTAAVETLMPEKLGGVKGFDYPTALKHQTDLIERFHGENPYSAAALSAAGSVAPVLATAGGAEVPTAVGKFTQALRMMRRGGAYGGVAGAASANSPEDILPGAAKGAAIGAVAGPIVSTLGGAGARGAAKLVRRIAPGNGLAKSAAEFVGAGPVTNDERASVQLLGALRKGGVEPSEAAAGLSVDQPTSMLDLGSRTVQSLARQARNVPASSAGQTIDRFLSERQAGTGNRIQNALTDATGHQATDIHQPVEELIAQRSAEAKPLYDAANAHGEIQNPETIAQIKALRQNPIFAKAWKRGQTLDALERNATTTEPTPPTGLDPNVWKSLTPKMKAQFAEATRPTAAADAVQSDVPTVAQINAWKKGLDATIESGYGSKNALSRSEARVYRQKLSDVLAMVDEEVPAYAQARQSFRGHSELKDAAEAGAKHFSQGDGVTADYLQRTLPEQYPTDGEQHAYQANALNAFAAKVRNLAANPDLPEAGRGTNIVQRVMGTEDAGKRLRMLFPDEQSYNGFVAKMEQEAKYPQTNKFLTQQSSTAAQMQENAMPPGMMGDIARAPFSTYAKAKLATRAITALSGGGKMSPQMADAIGRQSTATGTKLQDALRQMMSDENTTVQARQRIAKYLNAMTATNASNSP